MNDAERDPVLRRAIDELRRLPAADPEKMRRVVLAAAAARVAPADEPELQQPGRGRFIRWSAAAVLVAAAAIVGFIARGVWVSRASATAAVQVAAAPVGPLRTVSSSSSDVLPIPQQFVLRNAAAHRVSVVGDFNEWNPASAPMTRSSDSAYWSVIVPILPGRHLYGFMVDDSLYTLDPDPRAPRARDPDLGAQGSVVMVGRP